MVADWLAVASLVGVIGQARRDCDNNVMRELT